MCCRYLFILEIIVANIDDHDCMKAGDWGSTLRVEKNEMCHRCYWIKKQIESLFYSPLDLLWKFHFKPPLKSISFKRPPLKNETIDLESSFCSVLKNKNKKWNSRFHLVLGRLYLLFMLVSKPYNTHTHWYTTSLLSVIHIYACSC